MWLVAATVAAGLARGFSGFGTALIFMPVAAMTLGPRQAAPLLLAIDAVAAAALTPAAWRVADRRETGLLSLGLLVGVPIGTAILVKLDAVTLRWIICLMILGLLILLVSGWRFRRTPTPRVTMAVGVTGGVMSGVAGAGGPPVMAYLLGRGVDANRIRATFTVFITAANVLTAIALAVAGLFGTWLLAPLGITLPFYLGGVWCGARIFGLASEVTFRRITYAMIAVAALLSLPLLDPLLR